MSVEDFWNLEVWKRAHGMVLEMYALSKDFPDSERFGLTSQLQRASVSVSANIAEGFERYHFKDKTKFYYQSRGSLAEVQNFIFVAKDLEYISVEKARELFVEVQEVGKMLNGLIRANKNASS